MIERRTSAAYRISQRLWQTDPLIYCDCATALPRLMRLGRDLTVVCERCHRIVPTTNPAWDGIEAVRFGFEDD